MMMTIRRRNLNGPCTSQNAPSGASRLAIPSVRPDATFRLLSSQRAWKKDQHGERDRQQEAPIHDPRASLRMQPYGGHGATARSVKLYFDSIPSPSASPAKA